MYQYIWFNIYTIVMKEAECVTMDMPVPRAIDIKYGLKRHVSVY